MRGIFRHFCGGDLLVELQVGGHELLDRRVRGDRVEDRAEVPADLADLTMRCLRAHLANGDMAWVTDMIAKITPTTEACPACGEADHDFLVWQDDGETVKCQGCGHTWKP